MRLLSTLVIVLLSGCVGINNLSYKTAEELADKDESSLSESEHTRYDEIMGNALDEAEKVCKTSPDPYSIVFKLESDGKIQKYWIDGEPEFATCYGREFSKYFVFLPPRQPFYGVMHWLGKTGLIDTPVHFTPNENCNPRVNADAIITENDSIFTAHIKKLIFSQNPKVEEKDILINSIKFSVTVYNEKDSTKGWESGWNTEYDSSPVEINKTLKKGEILTIANLDINLDLSELLLNRSLWSDFVLIININDDTDLTIVTQAGFLQSN